MQRETAIADDYWSFTLKHGKKDQVEVALHNIELKYEPQLFFYLVYYN